MRPNVSKPKKAAAEKGPGERGEKAERVCVSEERERRESEERERRERVAVKGDKRQEAKRHQSSIPEKTGRARETNALRRRKGLPCGRPFLLNGIAFPAAEPAR
jgi:hypothetical protein